MPNSIEESNIEIKETTENTETTETTENTESAETVENVATTETILVLDNIYKEQQLQNAWLGNISVTLLIFFVLWFLRHLFLFVSNFVKKYIVSSMF